MSSSCLLNEVKKINNREKRTFTQKLVVKALPGVILEAGAEAHRLVGRKHGASRAHHLAGRANKAWIATKPGGARELVHGHRPAVCKEEDHNHDDFMRFVLRTMHQER